LWKTIPSHNPQPATSYPGQDIGALATILVGHQSAIPEGAVYPIHSSVPLIGTLRSPVGMFYPLDPSALPINTDNVINLNNDLLLNLRNLLDPIDVELDPSFFQNIYLMGSVTGSGIGTSPSQAFFTLDFSRNGSPPGSVLDAGMAPSFCQSSIHSNCPRSITRPSLSPFSSSWDSTPTSSSISHPACNKCMSNLSIVDDCLDMIGQLSDTMQQHDSLKRHCMKLWYDIEDWKIADREATRKHEVEQSEATHKHKVDKRVEEQVSLALQLELM
jgi:hypothetical protein